MTLGGGTIPTLEDFERFDGAHCRRLWKSTASAWRCPACKRSKFELLCWTRIERGRASERFGWMATLARHHDHGFSILSREQVGDDYRRDTFPDTVICGQCNAADGTAKRALGLSPEFTFSPEEIGEFVTASPHAAHQIDLEIARNIYFAARCP